MQENIEHKERPSRTRRAFQFIFLFLLLVVAPLGSWMYLRSGLDYRKEQLATLEEGVPIPSATWTGLDGKSESSANWSEQISLLLYANDAEVMQNQIDGLSLVLSQFNDREDVLFYQVIPDSIWQSVTMPLDTAQWKVLLSSESEVDSMQMICQRTFPVDERSNIFIIDRRNQLRQAFSIGDKASLTNLVEVVAILLPPRKLVHPELNRTKER